MSVKVTIYEVALAARVSLATVSRVLNNPEKVKPDTRERVLKVIKELGYRPNAIARGLASRKTTTVGVLVSDITRASVAEMLGGISDIAMKYSYSIKLFSAHEDVNIIELINDIVAEQVDGVLILNDELDASRMKKVKELFDENEIPFVLANVVNDDRSVPSVSIDYEKAGYEITKLMIEMGKKDIYMLSTVRKYSVNDKKELGYTKAMQEANLMPRVFRTSGTTSVNRQHFANFFADKIIDGAIGVRDSIAVSFMNIANESGRSVPEMVSVAGFQNTKYALLSRPTLTSIDIPVYDIGAVAMRLLTKLMNKEQLDSLQVVLPHYIVRRESL
ncbi:LacI family DNA-binding transcriptional regulator [Paracholeplasma manati]|jgi:LacI family transcriptional regulator|uniref:LacI family DNA-binding transcriptional regulator n=1 Tax=Paracholeplasma manati TaxID=591373 RepID=UPI002407EE35|nr:LacI family DNA-binding transcriptional regulator [Paracholeplasma manati]MDG0888686.1 LacI family DNA-binding transcriptional regulator [Paracholeplasma manati]MDX9807926.1 LacI family DNA-binding transcriptional regulator [Acholeplasma sp.]